MSQVISRQLECPICMEQLLVPKLLDCGHTFCLNCLDELPFEQGEVILGSVCDDNYDEDDDYVCDYDSGKEVSLDYQSRISCPLCRTRTNVPQEGLANLVPNFTVQSMLDSLTLESKVSDVSPINPPLGEDTPTTCTVHNELRKFYCCTCELLICRDCTIVDHPRPQHTFKNVDEAYQWRQETNKKELQKSTLVIRKSMKAKRALSAAADGLNQKCDQVIGEIEKCRQEGLGIVEGKMSEVSGCVSELKAAMEKLENLDKQSSMSTVLDQSKGLIEIMVSKRDRQHEVLKLQPGQLQYPLFMGMAEDIKQWPQYPPTAKKNTDTNLKEKKISSDPSKKVEKPPVSGNVDPGGAGSSASCQEIGQPYHQYQQYHGSLQKKISGNTNKQGTQHLSLQRDEYGVYQAGVVGPQGWCGEPQVGCGGPQGGRRPPRGGRGGYRGGHGGYRGGRGGQRGGRGGQRGGRGSNQAPSS